MAATSRGNRRQLRALDHTFRFLPPVLGEQGFTAEQIKLVMAEIREEFQRLLPQIPDIGGARNRLHTHILLEAAHNLALYNVLRRRGQTVAQVGPLIVETFRRRMFHYPRAGRWLASRLVFHRRLLDRFRRLARESQAREYPEHWVYRFVEGDGRNFDYGIDYEECAIVKFYRSQGAVELAPYCCQQDFPMSDALGWGLRRTTTIAEGGAICDFRFKRS